MVPTVHSCEHRLEAGIWILQRNPYHVRLVNYQSLPVSTTYRISFFGMKHLCKHVINRSMLFGTKPPERSETTGRSEWHGNSPSPVNSTQTQRLLLAGSTCFPYMSWWRSLERALLFFFFSSILNQIFKVWPEHLVKSSLRTRLGKKTCCSNSSTSGQIMQGEISTESPTEATVKSIICLNVSASIITPNTTSRAQVHWPWAERMYFFLFVLFLPGGLERNRITARLPSGSSACK